MAHAFRRVQDDFPPVDSALRPELAIVPPLREEGGRSSSIAELRPLDFSEKAYRALHIGFVALPIVAGVDKFTNELTNWAAYVGPSIPGIFHVSAPAFVLGLGTFEILLGIGVALKPRFFADLLSAYLVAIIVSFIAHGEHLDTALFTIALSAGACALARLSSARERGDFHEPDDEFEMPVRYRRAA